MPQPRSGRFDVAQRAPHTPIGRVDLEDGGGAIIQRDVPHMPGGNVTGDRNAPNQLVREVLTPYGALSDNARNAIENDLVDVYLRSSAGIRYTDTEMVGGLMNSLDTWTAPEGVQLVGLQVNGQGELVLGP